MLTWDSHDVFGERSNAASRVEVDRYGSAPLLVAVAPKLSEQSLSDRCKPVMQQSDGHLAAGRNARGVEHLTRLAGLPARIQTPVPARRLRFCQYSKTDLVPHQNVRNEVAQRITGITERTGNHCVRRHQRLVRATRDFIHEQSSIQLGPAYRLSDGHKGFGRDHAVLLIHLWTSPAGGPSLDPLCQAR